MNAALSAHTPLSNITSAEIGSAGEQEESLNRQTADEQPDSKLPSASCSCIQFLLPGTVKFFRYFACISNSVILLKFIQRIYAYEIII